MRQSAPAQIRFGYGFGPYLRRSGMQSLLDRLGEPDLAAQRHPSISYRDALALSHALRRANKALREGDQSAQDAYASARESLRDAHERALRVAFARILDSASPLRERLTWFWADHFTVAPKNPGQLAAVGSYVDDAIRPNVTGHFADMLKAVMRHPVMLIYLDQHRSVGPDSVQGQKSDRGLNENLARELLELHTVGVDAGYSQSDVIEAAELLTGLSVDWKHGFRFRGATVQPGRETVLGRTYAAGGGLAPIDSFLDDLAIHPATARHLARKLAVHFVADDPPSRLLADLEATYSASAGNLAEVTTTLVTHPETRAAPPAKAKQPMEFIASALLALGLRGSDMIAMPAKEFRRLVFGPLKWMGQPFMRAPGPDGWPEAPTSWITPQTLAARINWSAATARRLGGDIRDPRAFLAQTLPDMAGEALGFAVAAAETRAEAVALVLASSEFNRR